MAHRVRPGTLDDLDVLVHHRVAMFEDMGLVFDADELGARYRAWLQELMPAGTYRAWLVDDADGRVIAGGGATILPWPPGPQYPGTRLAFVYNVYTEPEHRRLGLGKLVMDAIREWCAQHGVTSIALNASRDGQPMYERLGYRVTPSPMMFLAVDKV